MEKGTILYFGTTCKGGGHNITLLKGRFDNREEESEKAAWLDGLSNRKDLQQFWPKYGSFGTIHFVCGTLYGVNLSPHDDRPGSKTYLYVEGESLSEQDMLKLVRQYPISRINFDAVVKKYKLTPPSEKMSGIELIAEERARQVEKEGYSHWHDLNHPTESFCRAAIAYALADIDSEKAKEYWPASWTEGMYKPKDIRRNLVRAGALIAAAIDRLQAYEK